MRGEDVRRSRRSKRIWQGHKLPNVGTPRRVDGWECIRLDRLPDLEERCKTSRVRIEGPWIVPRLGPVRWLALEASEHVQWWSGLKLRIVRLGAPRPGVKARISDMATVYWAQWFVTRRDVERDFRQTTRVRLDFHTASDAWHATRGAWPPPFKYSPTAPTPPPESALARLLDKVKILYAPPDPLPTLSLEDALRDQDELWAGLEPDPDP